MQRHVQTKARVVVIQFLMNSAVRGASCCAAAAALLMVTAANQLWLAVLDLDLARDP